MLKLLVIQSSSSKRKALITTANNPSVTTISGSVSRRRSVPITELISPNSSASQRYVPKPPETSIPLRSHAVIAKAAASASQRSSKATSMRGASRCAGSQRLTRAGCLAASRTAGSDPRAFCLFRYSQDGRRAGGAAELVADLDDERRLARALRRAGERARSMREANAGRQLAANDRPGARVDAAGRRKPGAERM